MRTEDVNGQSHSYEELGNPGIGVYFSNETPGKGVEMIIRCLFRSECVKVDGI